MAWVEIEPLDRAVLRDGRPFGLDNYRMSTLTWPLPSTVAGAVRTWIGKNTVSQGDPFSQHRLHALRSVAVSGPLLVERREGSMKEESSALQVFYPAPRDVVMTKDDIKINISKIVPQSLNDFEGTDLMALRSFPIHTLPGKPRPIPALWSEEAYSRWLFADEFAPASFPADDEERSALTAYIFGGKKLESGLEADGLSFTNGCFRDWPEVENRGHAKIDPLTNVAEDQGLFITSGIRLRPGQSLAVSLDEAEWEDAGNPTPEPGYSSVQSFGGERGLATMTRRNGRSPMELSMVNLPRCTKPPAIRMILVTHAIFAEGWRPGWLKVDGQSGRLVGTIPNRQVEVELETSIVGRWVPVSGWDFEHKRPKPMRKMVPLGSVYFLRVLSWGENDLADLWMVNVSDDPQDRRDGFGVAAFGLWHEANTTWRR